MTLHLQYYRPMTKYAAAANAQTFTMSQQQPKTMARGSTYGSTGTRVNVDRMKISLASANFTAPAAMSKDAFMDFMRHAASAAK